MSQLSIVGLGGAGLPQRLDSDNLWKAALNSLSEDDRSRINFHSPNLQVLSELHELTTKEIQRAEQGRHSFKRRNGQRVIVKDLFAKVAKWIDHFKQVVDVAVQYDPGHAALPWAGVRFLLEIAISDSKSRELILEHATSLAEIICRYAVFEDLLLRSPSAAVSEMKRALLTLYTRILIYLAKAKAYFHDNSLQRSIKNTILVNPDFDSHYKAIESAQVTVDQCIAVANVQGQIERHADLQKMLADIERPLARSANILGDIKDELDASNRTKILQWISTEPYEKHHKQAYADVLQGTGQWLLTDPVYRKWKKESASSILWLHGIPGSGKTKLVSTVIEDAVAGHQQGLCPEPVYFYCSRNPAEPGRSRPRDIVASLLRQLARINCKGPLLDPVTRAYRDEEEQGFSQGLWELDMCCDLIMDLLPCHQMVTIVIDAVDECDPLLRDDLLATLEDILQNSPTLVKIFVSSRDDQDIVCHLEGYPNLELSSERNSDDINNFLIFETDRLIQRRKLLRHTSDRDGLRSLIIERLREGAQGMFRWVALQLQALCDLKTDQAIRERIGKLPPRLEDLYQELLFKIENSPAQADRQYARNTFSWLLSARMPLKTDEFLVAISKSIGLGPGTLTKKHVLDLCCNLVIFDPTLETFRFAHLSVREYLEMRTEYTTEKTNALIAETCLLSLIASTDTQDTWAFLRPWNFTTSDLEAFKQLYTYAALFWTFHRPKEGETRPNENLEKLLSYFQSDEPKDKSPLSRYMCELPEVCKQLGYTEIELGGSISIYHPPDYKVTDKVTVRYELDDGGCFYCFSHGRDDEIPLCYELDDGSCFYCFSHGRDDEIPLCYELDDGSCFYCFSHARDDEFPLCYELDDGSCFYCFSHGRDDEIPLCYKLDDGGCFCHELDELRRKYHEQQLLLARSILQHFS